MRAAKENFTGYYSDLVSTVFSDGLGEIYNTEDGNFMFAGRITDDSEIPEGYLGNTDPTFLVLSTFKNADSDLGYVGLVSKSESIFFRISVTFDYSDPPIDSYDDKPAVSKNRSLSLIQNGQVVDVLPGSVEEKLFKKFLDMSKKTQPVANMESFKNAVCIKNKIEESLISGTGSS